MKDPIGTKGARLSTQISIAGRLLVYLPQDPHIGISQRIEDEAGRAALRERLKELVPPDEKGGFIVRTARRERDRGRAARRHRVPAPPVAGDPASARAERARRRALLYQDLSLAQRVLRDMVDERDRRACWSTRARTSRSSPPSPQRYMPQVRAEARALHRRAAAVRPVRRRGRDREGAGAPRRPEVAAATLIIDQTEALTTIDVNTGGFVGSRNFDDTIFKTNLEAAQAIARQLRLRNLGGIIIVDFIDMDSRGAPRRGARGVHAARWRATARA